MNPTSTNQSELNQAAIWTGTGARGWVEAQDILDRLFQPIADMLLESVRPGDRVLEVGCGTGALAVAAARKAAPEGSCTGIDISEGMIEAARLRSERDSTPVHFLCADAQAYAFQPGSFNRMVSRFGVMFFEDSVKAFANLHASTRPGSELQFVAWRSAEENPFMTAAETAAEPLLQLPKRRNDEPGQFGFANAHRVTSILERSGWTHIEVRPLDVPCRLTEADLLRYVSLLGPVGRYLQEADEKTRAEVIQLIVPAFDPYRTVDGARFNAACWRVTARS
jgi:SAM-dependent methyltransferase